MTSYSKEMPPITILQTKQIPFLNSRTWMLAETPEKSHGFHLGDRQGLRYALNHLHGSDFYLSQVEKIVEDLADKVARDSRDSIVGVKIFFDDPNGEKVDRQYIGFSSVDERETVEKSMDTDKDTGWR